MKLSLIIVASLLCVTPVFGKEAKQMPVTAQEQKAMTPTDVLADLMAGNRRFVSGELTDLNIKESVAATASGQFPKAVILSCLDSRVPVENVFDQGIGDVFVGRVAGNVEDVNMLGSFEFATKLAGSKLIMVLGHTACGAVKGACDHAEMGNLTGLLESIRPAVDAVAGDYPEDKRNSKNLEFVNAAVVENVKITVADIRKDSPMLAGMEKAGEIKIVGALYDLSTGLVTMVE